MDGIVLVAHCTRRGVIGVLFLISIVLFYAAAGHATTSCAECTGKTNQHTAHYLESVSDDNEQQDYLIQLTPGTNLSSITTKRAFSRFNITSVRGSAKAIRALLRNHAIANVELDAPIATLGDIVPYGVNATLAPTVWNVTNGTGIKVAILDTGIAPHPDLAIAGGTSIVSNNYTDTNGHGTAVAGVVAAIADGQGIVGVAPSASLYAVKIINGTTGTTTDAIAGIQWAIDNNMSIVVMSFGTPTRSEIFKSVLQDAYNHGILLIAASGNDGQGVVLYPAAYSSVIAVGAIDESNQRASFSNYGLDLELVAPGVGINTTELSSQYTAVSGTSMAAPHVAGVAALEWAVNRTLTNNQLRGKLRNDALDLGTLGRDDLYGNGLVQANLGTGNYSFNNSYYYQIYNITDYGFANETSVYWTDGRGTIDDVQFASGYYLVKSPPNSDRVIHVDENGTIVIQTAVSMDDNWSGTGAFDDGVVWNDSRYVRAKASTSNQAGECWDYQYDVNGGSNYSQCFFNSTAMFDACHGLFGYCNFGSGDNCTSGVSMGAYHTFLNGTSPVQSHQVSFFTFTYTTACNADSVIITPYAVIDEVRANCTTGGRNFTYQGRYDATNDLWTSFAPATCAAAEVCDPAAYRGTCNIQGCQPKSVCRKVDGQACTQDYECITNHICTNGFCQTPQACTAANGTLFISTEDQNGNPLPSLNVTLNGAPNTTTDAIGLATIHIPTVSCSAQQNVQVFCANSATACDVTKSATFAANGTSAALSFTCKECSTPNLYIAPQDVIVNLSSSLVTVQVHAAGLNATNLNVSVFLQDQGVLKANTSKLINVSADSATNVTFTLTMQEGQYVSVYVDKNGTFNDSKLDNYVLKPVVNPVNAIINVHVDSGVAGLNDTIFNYIASYVNPVSNPSSADVVIDVGPISNASFDTFINNALSQCVPNCTLPYTGVVNLQYELTSGVLKPHIYVMGNGLDGDIAAVKRLINARSIFLSKNSFATSNPHPITSYITDYDALGIGVADHIHNAAAQPTAYQNSTAFLETVKKILYDNNYETSIMTVETLNTTSYNQSTILRIKHVNSDFSAYYLAAVNPNATTPVVFSGGIFSNLQTWEAGGNGLARQMANDGYDIWEIEMTGGPYTDCPGQNNDTCPNYQYADLVNFYWPASVGGILKYSGKSQIDFVGHSNGGRVALSALNAYSQTGKNTSGYYFDYTSGQYLSAVLPAHSVRKFVGVAVPAVLNGDSTFTSTARSQTCYTAFGNSWLNFTVFTCLNQSVGNYSLSKIPLGTRHITMSQYVSPALYTSSSRALLDMLQASNLFHDATGASNLLSMNLMTFYDSLAESNTSGLTLSSVNVSAIYLVNNQPDDVIVPGADQTYILTTSNVSQTIPDQTFNTTFQTILGVKKNILSVNHAALTDNDQVKTQIRAWLQ